MILYLVQSLAGAGGSSHSVFMSKVLGRSLGTVTIQALMHACNPLFTLSHAVPIFVLYLHCRLHATYQKYGSFCMNRTWAALARPACRQVHSKRLKGGVRGCRQAWAIPHGFHLGLSASLPASRRIKQHDFSMLSRILLCAVPMLHLPHPLSAPDISSQCSTCSLLSLASFPVAHSRRCWPR